MIWDGIAFSTLKTLTKEGCAWNSPLEQVFTNNTDEATDVEISDRITWSFVTLSPQCSVPLVLLPLTRDTVVAAYTSPEEHVIITTQRQAREEISSSRYLTSKNTPKISFIAQVQLDIDNFLGMSEYEWIC